MCIMCFFTLLIISIPFSPVLTYRFLGIFPFNGKSHNLFFEALMKSLAREGHEVDVISHFSEPDPPKNYNVIVNLEGTTECLVNNVTYEYMISVKNEIHVLSTTFGNQLCDLMGLQEIQNLIKTANTRTYNGVIVEAFAANCFMGFGHLLKVPVIGITSFDELPWINEYMGSRGNFGIRPTVYTTTWEVRNFWERLKNVITHYHSLYLFYSYSGDYQTEAMRKYLGPDMPNIREIEKSVALMLVNGHSSFSGIKPLPSSVIQLAGLHIEADNTKLTPELQKWMDESVDGVVYFSFGSFIVLESFPEELMLSIYACFAKIYPTRVLMKVMDVRNLPPGLPDNVIHLPWIPQIPVLGHPNTRVFLNHGGLMGIIEAIYHGVPMITAPFIKEQWRNANNMASKNISILLPIDKLTEATLTKALKTILHDSKYRDCAKKLSKIFRDRPMTSMKTALFWINYIIKYGPNMLKSPSAELKWWQAAVLDIYGFILVCVAAIILICVFVLFKVYKYIYTQWAQYFPSKTKSN